MSEEKDDAQMAQEQAMVEARRNDGGVGEIHGVPPQIQPTLGLPDRKAVKRHRARVHEIMHTRRQALEAIRADLEGTSKYRGRDVA
jgi:phospholipid/cholesterol/gamma-HCH transport system ATP-binding protein